MRSRRTRRFSYIRPIYFLSSVPYEGCKLVKVAGLDGGLELWMSSVMLARMALVTARGRGEGVRLIEELVTFIVVDWIQERRKSSL